jgi:hypothetical protein
MINEIDAGLEQAGYEAWQVVWGLALNADRSNLVYTARNSQTGQLAAVFAAAISLSGSIGLKTPQRSDLYRMISSSQAPARPRRLPSAPPSVSADSWIA